MKHYFKVKCSYCPKIEDRENPRNGAICRSCVKYRNIYQKAIKKEKFKSILNNGKNQIQTKK